MRLSGCSLRFEFRGFHWTRLNLETIRREKESKAPEEFCESLAPRPAEVHVDYTSQ